MNFFDCFAGNEPDFTRALAGLFNVDRNLLKKYIKKITKINLNKNNLKTLEINPEISENNSRFDICCENENFKFIIEAKISNNTVGQNQIDKYIEILKCTKKEKFIITLTEVDQPELYSQKNIKIYNSSWSDIVELLNNESLKIDITKEFKEYMEKKMMKTYDIDIWAVSVKGQQLENFNKGYYCNHNKHSPILIGLREQMPDGKVRVKRLYPVIEVIDKNSDSIKEEFTKREILPEDGWKENPPNIYVLGKELALEEPLDKSFKGYQKSFVAVDFSSLN